MKGKRGLVRAFVATIIAGVVTVGVLEGAVRVLRLIPDDAPIPYRPMPGDENFGPVPNESAVSVFGTSYRTDAYGLRGADRPLDRVAGRARVAVLGDSVVWGVGLPEEATIPVWLERAAADRQLQLEAWNLGVPANNAYNERARYARLAPLIRPDVTVVVVVFNDLEPGPDRVRIT